MKKKLSLNYIFEWKTRYFKENENTKKKNLK